LKKKLQDLEENNKNLDLKIIKTKKCIKRLKVEKGFLLEKLDKIKKTSDIDSDDSEIENNTPQQTVKVEEKHQRKKQKVVDPLAPKKPANAFFRFCQLQRKNMNSQINQIKSEDSSNSDITKILSNQWKQLPKEEKQIYYDLYEKDKVRYEKELEAYNNSDHKKNKDLASGKGQTKPKSKSTSTNKNTNKSNSNNPSTPSSIKQVTTNDDTKSEPATDDINSVNDAQTEFSFNNVTNNDDMQIDETNDKKSNVNTTNKERKDINEEDTTISNINEVHPLSRSTSVDYSGETTQSIIDSTMDDSNDNDIIMKMMKMIMIMIMKMKRKRIMKRKIMMRIIIIIEVKMKKWKVILQMIKRKRKKKKRMRMRKKLKTKKMEMEMIKVLMMKK